MKNTFKSSKKFQKNFKKFPKNFQNPIRELVYTTKIYYIDLLINNMNILIQ